MHMKAWFKNLFIPSHENSYAPQSLQKVAVVGMFVLILLSFTLTNVQSLMWMASDWMVSTILPAVIVSETNSERVSDALPALRRNATLDAAAKLKAEHMAKNEYFAHYSPDGVSPWYWFGQVDYNFVHAGENLAIHFTDSGEVVDAWMDSPTHRANIMNGDYVEIGVGTAEGTYEGFSTVYVVQLFGTPSAAAGAVAGAEVAAVPTPAAQPEITEEVAVVTAVEEVMEPVPAPAEEEVLADEVAINETVAVIPAEPVPVTVAAEPEMAVTDSGVALYLDHVSTSTGGVPAAIEGTPTFTEPVGPTALLTKPHFVLQLLYAIIGLFVLVSLLLSVFIEFRHQQPLQIAYGFVLLALMSGLFYAHVVLTTGVTIA
jgi:hypothetical protein